VKEAMPFGQLLAKSQVLPLRQQIFFLPLWIAFFPPPERGLVSPFQKNHMLLMESWQKYQVKGEETLPSQITLRKALHTCDGRKL